MNDYVIAIPTYRRVAELTQKTLKTLHDAGIDPSIIHIFVANQDEYARYICGIDPKMYGKMIVGELGIVQQRLFISKCFQEGEYVVFIDDDIEDIDLTMSCYRGLGLDGFIKAAFEKCYDVGSYIWGVYPSFNSFFREQKKEIRTGLTFIIGCFYGIVNRRIVPLIENPNKEDVERSIQYFIRDGTVLRFDRVAVKTWFFAAGGIGSFKNRLEPSREACDLLKHHYGDYGNIWTRKNGMTEFKFKKL